MFVLVVTLVTAVVALVVVAVVLAVGRESGERRGGLLELDTWEARNALRHGGPSSRLQRCNPDRHVHFHGDGDWCECGLVPNVRAVRPFAGQGGDAA